MASILILMILFHIIDDFVLQPICLSKLKQKSFWQEQNLDNNLYKNDYLASLIILHGLSWSAMVHIPTMYLFNFEHQLALLISFLVHAIIHAMIDDLKANKKTINLITDQTLHLIQIVLIFISIPT